MPDVRLPELVHEPIHGSRPSCCELLGRGRQDRIGMIAAFDLPARSSDDDDSHVPEFVVDWLAHTN